MKYFNSHQFGLLDMISENNIIVNQLMRAEFVRLVWLNQKKSISCPNLLLCCDGGLSRSFNSLHYLRVILILFCSCYLYNMLFDCHVAGVSFVKLHLFEYIKQENCVKRFYNRFHKFMHKREAVLKCVDNKINIKVQ